MKKKRSVVTREQQNSIVESLIEMFELPPFLSSLKIEWEVNSIIKIETVSYPHGDLKILEIEAGRKNEH